MAAGPGTGMRPWAPTDAQVDQRGAAADDIADRVERAHLVELDVVGRDAVHGTLGVGEGPERRVRAVAHPRLELGGVEQAAHLPPGTMGMPVRGPIVGDVVGRGVGRRARRAVDNGRLRAHELVSFGALHHDLELGVDGPDGRAYALERGAGIHQGAEQHVAGHARGAVDPAERHARLPRAMRAAWTPAEKPLSMLTTTTPGAQELSIPSRAASPWQLAP